MKKLLGYTLIAIPFIALFGLFTIVHGLMFTVSVFGAAIGIIGLTYAGVQLAYG